MTERRIANQIRRPGSTPGRPVPDQRRPDAGTSAGGPQTSGRPMPEYPRAGYGAYRLFGRLPGVTGRRARLVDLVLGRPRWHLYTGITSRPGFVRWVEHSDTKTWAGDVDVCELVPGAGGPPLQDTLANRRSGRPWLV